MHDLFRFLMLRPATPVKPSEIKLLAATFVQAGASREVTKREAQGFVDNNKHAKSGYGLKYADAALDVAVALAAGGRPVVDVEKIVSTRTGDSCAKAIADTAFDHEEQLLANSLVAMKLLSNSASGDAPGLAQLALGYDAIRRVAGGAETVSLRVLSIDDVAHRVPPKDGGGDKGEVPTKEPPRPAPDGKAARELKRLDEAIATIRAMPAAEFRVNDHGETSAAVPESDARPEAPQSATSREHDHSAAAVKASVPLAVDTRVARPWLLSSRAVSAVPPEVLKTLTDARLSLRVQPLPVVLNALHALRLDVIGQLEIESTVSATLIQKIGGIYAPWASNDYVGAPSGAMPSGHGSIRPVGIGDLLVVKEHVVRYEGGDLAHVENVLKSESISRETRRLERTETTLLRETESTKEESHDTQSTDRFSLKRETSDTIKTDTSVKAGLAVDAKYGPFVEVKANADFATSTATESAAKQASEFSKEVVTRSASKLVERVLERRSTTTVNEFEEKYSHGFDNTAGAGHISGYYQWIDKVLQAQVYNYGKRLLFDVTLPEPGTNFILAQVNAKTAAQDLVKPPEFNINAKQINEGNYRIWAQRYDATGLEPAPPPVKTISKSFDAVVSEGPHESSKSETLAIDDGYAAKYVLLQHSSFLYSDGNWEVLVGSNAFNAIGTDGYADMAGEVGSVPIAYRAYRVRGLAATIEIFCERTDRAYDAWQLKTHAAITLAHLAKQQAYEQALARAQAEAGVVISGRNPIFNLKLVASELREQCISLITEQHFNAFGALELTADGYAQPNFARTAAQMPYVRFFEQAFEWEHIMYFFYPYFWGWKQGWKNRMLLDDVDPRFGDFLRAGAARVVFPVRPGFEAAVVHYLETGEIWNGGPPPDISGSLYVPIIKEIQEATGAPGGEVAQGDSWEVRLPTTLVRIRANNDLPTWQKVGDNWQATN